MNRHAWTRCLKNFVCAALFAPIHHCHRASYDNWCNQPLWLGYLLFSFFPKQADDVNFQQTIFGERSLMSGWFSCVRIVFCLFWSGKRTSTGGKKNRAWLVMHGRDVYGNPWMNEAGGRGGEWQGVSYELLVRVMNYELWVTLRHLRVSKLWIR